MFSVEKVPNTESSMTSEGNSKNTTTVEYLLSKLNAHNNSSKLLTKVIRHDLKETDDEFRQAEVDRNLFFRDGKRKIDFVLAFEDKEEDAIDINTDESDLVRFRNVFVENIKTAGLHVELEPKSESFDKKTSFLKVHAPNSVIKRNADITGLKPHVKDFIVTYYSSNLSPTSVLEQLDKLKTIGNPLTSRRIPPEPNIFNSGFMPTIIDKFVTKLYHEDYSHMQRSQIVWQILTRIYFENYPPYRAGIQRLIKNGSFIAAFPLHDGDCFRSKDLQNTETNNKNTFMNIRRLLYLEWGSLRSWYKLQPLWLIRQYFGIKIGLYFAWLGFYTQNLVIPSIVGLITFIFGCVTMNTYLNTPSLEICNKNGAGNITMCPQCEKYCSFWKLSDACLVSKITYLFDNVATISFTIFMNVWAYLFLELWRRRQNILKWEWELGGKDHDDDEIRPEFEHDVKTRRLNPVTQKKEPYVSGKQKTFRIAITSSAILFLLCCIMGAVFSVIVFRVVIITFMYQATRYIKFFSSNAKLIATGTAAFINAIVIEISGFGFQIIARILTNKEQPRTQSDYENSYTFKMYLFQFINYYSSLIYTAFFKGRFFSYPGDDGVNRNVIVRLKTDICDPGGCLYELCIMLGMYMIGRQFVSNTMELYYPKLRNWWREYALLRRQRNNNEVGIDLDVIEEENCRQLKRWEKDYQLQELDRLHLFDEYIEMVIQFGFVTMFVAACPLTPLLALINNIFEIRLDAYKYTTLMRRPLGQRVHDIGIWMGIMDGMTQISVVFNAFIIALTSEFIPKLVYLAVYSENYSLEGYMEYSLAVFRTSDWGDTNSTNYAGPIALMTDYEIAKNYQTCRFNAYRIPPGEKDEYNLNKTWWHIFAARLAFIIVYEHIVILLTQMVSYIIPKVPYSLKTQLQRERQLKQEKLFAYEINQNKTENFEFHSANGSSLNTLVSNMEIDETEDIAVVKEVEDESIGTTNK